MSETGFKPRLNQKIKAMKAILNVNPKSAYGHLNGKVFEVEEVGQSLISLDMKGTTTDFTHAEVLIVDFHEELQSVYDSMNFYGGIFTSIFNNMEEYAKVHNYICTPEYHCAP